ncbi:MAG: outer membrane protein assembly factor BamD [Neomegalonema sp.]|nr:outer membrane protein assembly factor BamD [Neomegalonema sp.]
MIDQNALPLSQFSSALRAAFKGSLCVAAVSGLLLVAACSSGGSSTEAAQETPANEIFQEATQALADDQPVKAAQLFDEVERLYPTSQWAKRAIIMSAFSSYEAGRYDESVLSARRFLDFYPSDDDAPYAQYLIAMSHYERIVDVGRDQARTRDAMQALRELVNRYPDSEYAREAQLKLDLTMDHLAGKEMEVGRWYLKNHKYIAAINRFRTVVERYQTTRHVEEALHRLVEAYLSLGVNNEAQTAAAVLGHNFPGSEWYQDSYLLLTGKDLRPAEDKESWISRTWRRLTTNSWL